MSNRFFNLQKNVFIRKTLRREMPKGETRLWILLKNRNLGYKFRRQYSVDQYVIDFYSPKLRLALEIDGDVHDEPDQKKYDLESQEDIEKFGITFVRITNEELLGNPNKAFAKIEGAIKILERKK